MSLNDPFSTTYQGSLQAGESLGQGIQQAAGSFSDVMKQKALLKQQQKQRQQGFDTLKTLGLIKENPPTNDELANGLKQAGAKMGRQITINQGGDEDTARQNMMGIYKAMGIPMPKGTITIQPGAKLDLTTGDASIEGQKPESEETKAMKEMTMQLRQEDEERKQREEEERKSEFQQKQQAAKDAKEQKEKELKQNDVKQAGADVNFMDRLTNSPKYREQQKIQGALRQQLLNKAGGQTNMPNKVEYNTYKSQLQPGEILVIRNGKYVAITQSEKQPTDQVLQ